MYMFASDYEPKSHLKYDIFIKNVISCANKQTEICLLLPFILQFRASGKDPILVKV